MTATNGRSLSSGASMESVEDKRGLFAGVPVRSIMKAEQLVFVVPLAAAAAGAVVGAAALFANNADTIVVPVLGLLAISMVGALAIARIRVGIAGRVGPLLVGFSVAAIFLLLLLPEWMYGGEVNGIVHRSIVSGPLLLVLSTATGANALRSLLGASPSGQDLSLFPLLGLPVVLALVAYSVVLGRILFAGLGALKLDLLTTAWRQVQGPSGFTYQLGFLNNILGTFLLVAMTLLIAILPGVGAGVFMSEFPGRLSRLIDFCTTMLRAVSMFIVGAAAFGLVHLVSDQPAGTILSDVIRGSYHDATGIRPERGSFLMASIFLALLVVPVIAKLTEEGLRSVPREIREGSVALGATEAHSLRRILLPWAAPNILTALVIAGAEAAGSLAVIMFLAGTGENGVGPFSGVTTLDYAVFATKYGPRVYFQTMKDYQSTAALLLLFLTLGLTVLVMLLQRRFAKRYRGLMTGH